MKSFLNLSVLLGAAFFAENAFAHPGHNHAAEQAERRAHLANSKRSLAHCADSLRARGNEAAMMARRQTMAENLRKKRSAGKPYLRVRDEATVLATDHHSNLTGITENVDPSVIFTGNNSCILTPEVTEGPYYVSGEFVRRDVTEDQEGVGITLDIQIIDTDTCEPVPQVYLELWHCNSTGVYGGIVASGNGNQNDATNINNTFLRGIQPSDTQGVVTFDTLVPGHYTGRTNHIHVLAHHNISILPNDTITGGTISHVGQLFFDQDLVTQVEQTAPYNTNTQNLTTNEEDSIFAEEAETTDPVIEYVLLGDSVADGLFGWIAFGINVTNSKTVSAAATLTGDGGVANNNTGGFGGGAPSGSGFPSGSGAPPASTSA